jgi:hypothetical protein
MTNFKKIGLTALAGTLAATAFAQAGALSVSGTARMEYQSTYKVYMLTDSQLIHLHKTHQLSFLVQVN